MSAAFRNPIVRALDDVDLRPSAGNRSVEGRVYAEQLDVSLRLAPFAVLSALIDVLLHATAFWSSGSSFIRIGWLNGCTV